MKQRAITTGVARNSPITDLAGDMPYPRQDGEQQGKERNIPDSQECQTAGSGHHVSLCEHVHQEFTDSAVINEPLNNEQNQ